MLFFGFLFLSTSREFVRVKATFPSPKAGAVEDFVLAIDPLLRLFALLSSEDVRGSFSTSLISFVSFTLAVSVLARVLHLNKLLVAVLDLLSCGWT